MEVNMLHFSLCVHTSNCFQSLVDHVPVLNVMISVKRVTASQIPSVYSKGALFDVMYEQSNSVKMHGINNLKFSNCSGIFN